MSGCCPTPQKPRSQDRSKAPIPNPDPQEASEDLAGLHPDMLEGSRLFFHSFIDAVLIGPESAVIKYTIGGDRIGGDRITPNQYGPPARSFVHEINLTQL